jgi:cobalt-precorrin 5A hydrolase/precorrin-3B C17-methyltransferase
MIAVVALGPGGLALAQRLVAELPDATLHGYAPRIADAAVRFDDVAGHLGGLFADGQPIVALCAAGIVIRSLAPLLRDKRTEPAVVAVAEDGSVAVPLLGGHHGANDLARQVAAIVGGVAAITTAGDVRRMPSTTRPGWPRCQPRSGKSATAALPRARLDRNRGSRKPTAIGCVQCSSPRGVGEGGAPSFVSVTDHPTAADDNGLILHPRHPAVIGCERGTSPMRCARS